MSNKSKLSCSKKKNEKKERPCTTHGHLLNYFLGGRNQRLTYWVTLKCYDRCQWKVTRLYDYFNPYMSVIWEVQRHRGHWNYWTGNRVNIWLFRIFMGFFKEKKNVFTIEQSWFKLRNFNHTSEVYHSKVTYSICSFSIMTKKWKQITQGN